MKKDLIYNSETGDVIDPNENQDGVMPVEPLRIPGVVDQFIREYIPAPNEQTADVVIPIGELRTRLSCWFTFGAKVDVLQEYLEELANMGYVMQYTSSGPAMCLMCRNGGRVINVYEEAEEVKDE